jgi:small subunit ribosomal protein S1
MANPDDEDFAALLAEYEGGAPKKKRREPEPGEELSGRVVSIGRDAAFIDVGGKSDAMIDLAELRDADGRLTVQVGDELTGRVVEVNGKAGCIVLRRALGRGPDARGELETAFAHGIPVEGTVTAVNKGGVEVQVAGVRAFCPLSQLDARPVEDAAAYVGQKLRFRITRYEAAGPRVNVVVSRRVLVEEEQAAQAQLLRGRLQPGAVLRGRVTAIKDYGAFVDLGGLEGMLHVSELGFARVAHPKDVLTVGQEIEVQVLRVEKSDDPKRPERIALSLKSLERDPWSDVAARFAEGARVRGRVARLESYGAFVEIAPGVEGLVHVSELGGGRPLRHARDAARVGEELEVVVLGLDVERRRISLGRVAPGDEADAPPPTLPAPRLGTFADLFNKRKK